MNGSCFTRDCFPGRLGRFCSVMPAVMLGMKDSFSPCAFVTVVIFVMLLARFGATSKSIIAFGAIFMVSAVLTKYLIIFGFLDFILVSVPVNQFFVNFYFITGVVLSFVGLVHFRDWLEYSRRKEVNRFLIKLPSLLLTAHETGAGKRKKTLIVFFKIIFLILFFIVTGASLTIMSSIWTKDYHLFWIYMSLLATRDYYAAAGTVSMSVMMYFLPLMACWLMLVWVSRSQKIRESVTAHAGRFKLLCSLIAIATGVGLIVAFI